MPLRDWKTAINQFMIMYQDRMPNFNKAVYTDLFTLSTRGRLMKHRFETQCIYGVTVYDN